MFVERGEEVRERGRKRESHIQREEHFSRGTYFSSRPRFQLILTQGPILRMSTGAVYDLNNNNTFYCGKIFIAQHVSL